MLQLKIKLRGVSKPTVWRRALVPENYTFLDLHYVIQAVFGWQNCHLFQFSQEIYNNTFKVIALPYEDNIFGENEHIIDAREVKLSSIFNEEGKEYAYLYDFGDEWIHDIILEKITDEEFDFPKCIGGRAYTPPENCGGVVGYQMLKQRFIQGPRNFDLFKMLASYQLYGEELVSSAPLCKKDMKDIDNAMVEIFSDLHSKK